MKDIRTYLKDNILLFDGAMGTYYAARSGSAGSCEQANLSDAEAVAAIHRAYLEAGAQALKTNTFALNRLSFPAEECAALLEAGWRIASQAAGERAYVFADIGPIEPLGGVDLGEEYRFVAERFLALGARHFLFETNGTDEGLHEAAALIKAAAPEAFVLVSFAAQPDGFTRAGRPAAELLAEAEADGNIDAVGLNCVSGARHMAELAERLSVGRKPFSVMPNAGYPTVRGNRTYYDGDPAYFAGQLAALRSHGAAILGGCCGTTPAHIAAVAQALQGEAPARVIYVAQAKETERGSHRHDPFWDALCDPSLKPFAVELDPPANADVSKFMAGARELRAHGADIITVADCPVARARIDSSLMACKIQRELGLPALPHMTCRDRNLNATQALLLGLCAEGVGNVLIVTGDPVPSASRDEVKSVYNFHSRKLMAYVRSLNETLLPTPFRVFGALNLNARNFSVQLGLAQEKEANGAVGFLTQPVLTPQAFENLKLARETLKGKILGGIMPIVSQRNALYMNSEIAGITVDERLIALYEGADREQGEVLAVEISSRIAREIAPYVDGYYLMTPFGRTALVGRIMDEIRKESNN